MELILQLVAKKQKPETSSKGTHTKLVNYKDTAIRNPGDSRKSLILQDTAISYWPGIKWSFYSGKALIKTWESIE